MRLDKGGDGMDEGWANCVTCYGWMSCFDFFCFLFVALARLTVQSLLFLSLLPRFSTCVGPL